MDCSERRFIKLPSTFLNATDFTVELQEKSSFTPYKEKPIIDDFSNLTDEEDEKNRQVFQKMMKDLSDKLKSDSQ